MKANRVFEAPTNANDEVKSSSQSNEKERKLLQFRITLDIYLKTTREIAVWSITFLPSGDHFFILLFSNFVSKIHLQAHKPCLTHRADDNVPELRELRDDVGRDIPGPGEGGIGNPAWLK